MSLEHVKKHFNQLDPSKEIMEFDGSGTAGEPAPDHHIKKQNHPGPFTLAYVILFSISIFISISSSEPLKNNVSTP